MVPTYADDLQTDPENMKDGTYYPENTANFIVSDLEYLQWYENSIGQSVDSLHVQLD